jgi:hypothetical protein
MAVWRIPRRGLGHVPIRVRSSGRPTRPSHGRVPARRSHGRVARRRIHRVGAGSCTEGRVQRRKGCGLEVRRRRVCGRSRRAGAVRRERPGAAGRAGMADARPPVGMGVGVCAEWSR